MIKRDQAENSIVIIVWANCVSSPIQVNIIGQQSLQLKTWKKWSHLFARYTRAATLGKDK